MEQVPGHPWNGGGLSRDACLLRAPNNAALGVLALCLPVSQSETRSAAVGVRSGLVAAKRGVPSPSHSNFCLKIPDEPAIHMISERMSSYLKFCLGRWQSPISCFIGPPMINRTTGDKGNNDFQV